MGSRQRKKSLLSCWCGLLAILTLIQVGYVAAVSLDEKDEKERIKVFFAWLKEHGADMDSVAWPVDFPETGRGVLALRDIKDGDEFLKIPLSVCMTNRTAEGTPLEPVTRQFDGFEGLILVLMNEKIKGSTSPWKPYLDILPSSFDRLGMWTEEELSELHDSHLSNQIIKDQAWTKAHHAKLVTMLREGGIHIAESFDDLSLYNWAYSVAATRCFQVSDELPYGLVPGADLLNHHEESPTTWVEKDGMFIMFARGGGFEKGTQVFNHYGGDPSNYRMLLDYGFMKSGNSLSMEKVPIDSLKNDAEDDDPLLALKKKTLRRDHIRLFAKMRPLVILRYFRVLSATNEEDIASFHFPTKWDMEHVAASVCYRTLKRELEGLPTLIEQDYELLSKTMSGTRRRLAIAYRIERKGILRRSADFCASVVDDVLPCIAPSAVTRPKYVRQILEASRRADQGDRLP